MFFSLSDCQWSGEKLYLGGGEDLILGLKLSDMLLLFTKEFYIEDYCQQANNYIVVQLPIFYTHVCAHTHTPCALALLWREVTVSKSNVHVPGSSRKMTFNSTVILTLPSNTVTLLQPEIPHSSEAKLHALQ